MFSSSFLVQKMEQKERAYLLDTIRHKLSKRPDILHILHGLSDDVLYTLYESFVSVFQSRQSSNGNHLEDVIANHLSENGVSFKRQVPVNREGYICTRKEGVVWIDFVLQGGMEESPGLEGTHISSCIVLSVKKSCRERWLQDEWTFTHKPKKYILFTLSEDYPHPVSKFREDASRKIITQKPKKNDIRQYKLTPDDLLKEVSTIF